MRDRRRGSGLGFKFNTTPGTKNIWKRQSFILGFTDTAGGTRSEEQALANQRTENGKIFFVFLGLDSVQVRV
jgi:hypothetical protein